MDNIKQTEQELIKLRERFLEDPIIEEHYKRLLSLYQHSIPIGIDDNGFIYDENITKAIEFIKEKLGEYIEIMYGNLGGTDLKFKGLETVIKKSKGINANGKTTRH